MDPQTLYNMPLNTPMKKDSVPQNLFPLELSKMIDPWGEQASGYGNNISCTNTGNSLEYLRDPRNSHYKYSYL